MRFKYEFCLAGFLALLVLGITSVIIEGSQASTKQDVDFEVVEWGDQSGYNEETYLVVKTEAEWAKVLAKHTAPHMSTTPYPEINFPKNMVICAFMGKRPTTGYSMSIRRIWAEGERIHVEIAKSDPPENLVVSEVITYPYVFASLERTDWGVMFTITEEDGTVNEVAIPEFPMMAFTVTAFIVLSAAMVSLTRKVRRNDHSFMKWNCAPTRRRKVCILDSVVPHGKAVDCVMRRAS